MLGELNLVLILSFFLSFSFLSFSFLFSFFLMATSVEGCSWARDLIQIPTATYATAVAMLILNPLCQAGD